MQNHQAVVIHFFYQGSYYGLPFLWKMLKEAWQYKQNIFIDCQRAVSLDTQNTQRNILNISRVKDL